MKKKGKRKIVEFDKCFNIKKIKEIEGRIPEAQIRIQELTRKKKLPKKIHCMSEKDIKDFRGASGVAILPDKIKINPNMGSHGILFNYIHENIHIALPSASENLVDHLTDLVAYQMELPR